MVSDLSKTRRASVHTLGCRLNQSESQLIREKLAADGYAMTPFGERADLGIINTCTVTREAEAKCRQAIRLFIRRNPQAFTAVVGCYSQMGAKAIADIPGVDLIIGNQEKLSVLDYVGFGKNERPVIVRERIDRGDFSIHFVGDQPFNKRANLKIQDGCDFLCSFCIIPFARGRARCRDFDNLMAEARSLADRGVQEIVLTGVNIGTYNNEGRDIVSLVDSLDAIPGLHRLRVSSIEPTTIPTALFQRMRSTSHALLPFLHIPMQSGSNKILGMMRRKYTAEEFAEFVGKAAETVPGLCLGTDILAGYPGESEDDFEQTCQVFLKNPFAYCHVFPFSERPGTIAGSKADQVPVPERNRRCAYLRRLGAQKRYDFSEKHLGQTLEVLFEDSRKGLWPGYTGNYIRVICQSSENLANRRAMVKLEQVQAEFVEGSIVEMLD